MRKQRSDKGQPRGERKTGKSNRMVLVFAKVPPEVKDKIPGKKSVYIREAIIEKMGRENEPERA